MLTPMIIPIWCAPLWCSQLSLILSSSFTSCVWRCIRRSRCRQRNKYLQIDRQWHKVTLLVFGFGTTIIIQRLTLRSAWKNHFEMLSFAEEWCGPQYHFAHSTDSRRIIKWMSVHWWSCGSDESQKCCRYHNLVWPRMFAPRGIFLVSMQDIRYWTHQLSLPQLCGWHSAQSRPTEIDEHDYIRTIHFNKFTLNET